LKPTKLQKYEATICNLLQSRLKELLSEQARAILQPFLDQAQSIIIAIGHPE
jgi:hypothetical protein